jgi:hypothetical protein
MATGRWNRTSEQLLEQQVRDLTNLLAQARAATDLQLVRDMFSRAGISYREEAAGGGEIKLVTGTTTMTFRDSGSFLRFS